MAFNIGDGVRIYRNVINGAGKIITSRLYEVDRGVVVSIAEKGELKVYDIESLLKREKNGKKVVHRGVEENKLVKMNWPFP